MARHKITALKDVRVCSHVWFQGSIPLPRGRQGESQGRMAQMQNREETFSLQKGQSRDDIAFLVDV